jgi:hypothetical protein
VSVFGIFIIFAYTVVILAVVTILHFLVLRRYVWRWVITVPLVLGAVALAAAPFLEEAQIASRFEELCRDAGIRVSQRVEAPGFYDATLRSGYEYINRVGFAFMEHPAADDRRKVEHVEKSGDGWKRTLLERPSARYHLIESHADTPVGHKIWVQERAIFDSETKAVIARDTTYKRIANAVDQAWKGALGSTLRTCHGSLEGAPAFLVDQAIRPLKRQKDAAMPTMYYAARKS